MPRLISIVLAMLACLAMPLAFSWADTPGLLYDDGVLVGEVLEMGPVLGWGGFGKVREITFKTPEGVVRKMALKLFYPSVRAQQIQETKENWELLEAVHSDDKEGVVSYGRAGLKLIPHGSKGPDSVSQALLTELADGSVMSMRSALRLEPKDPYLNLKIELALKYKRQVLSALTLLSSHGLTHGDIKPENVLYRTDAGFDFAKPDVSKIHFSLSDFDTLAQIGAHQPVHSEDYAAPEMVIDENTRASIPRDLYSHAVSVHALVFGDRPFEKQFKSLHGSATPAQFDAHLYKIFDNPTLYDRYLKSVDRRFQDLEEGIKSEAALQNIKELHAFVLNGLKLSTHERLAAFPEIKDALRRYAQAQKACGKSILTNLSHMLY